MLAYVTIGTKDLPRAAAYFDQLLAVIGGKRMMETEQFVAWDGAPGAAGLGVCKPFDGQAACVGNGVMVALLADSRETVDRVYAKALELGGTDEGAPGQRSEGFYAGYFRDLDGNKFNASYMGP